MSSFLFAFPLEHIRIGSYVYWIQYKCFKSYLTAVDLINGTVQLRPDFPLAKVHLVKSEVVSLEARYHMTIRKKVSAILGIN